MTDTRVHVALLTGFLGTGKTTLLNAVLANSPAGRIAVIVNEFGEAGLDHDLIEGAHADVRLMQSGWLCCSIRGDLSRTIGALILAGTLGAQWLRLRLDVVETDACRRVHLDRVTGRLVCTYRGTGTQYGMSKTGDPEVIHTVPTGCPFVMRGTLWPTPPGPGLLHRSPPIKGTGETRLLLALDPVADPVET